MEPLTHVVGLKNTFWQCLTFVPVKKNGFVKRTVILWRLLLLYIHSTPSSMIIVLESYHWNFNATQTYEGGFVYFFFVPENFQQEFIDIIIKLLIKKNLFS